MEVVTEAENPLALQGSSWADELPPTTELPTDDTSILNPAPNACIKCGQEIVREPGKRGRLPKYHPECKPERKSVSGSARVIRVSKAEEIAAQQVEFAIERARRGLAKAVALLSLVDPYDALVVHVNSPEILDNLRGVLMRFEWLRSAASNVQTGGDIFGLVLAILTTLLPIAAHHKLIPSRKVASILVRMPLFMLRLQERLATGNEEEVKDELLHRVAEEGKRQTEARMRQQTEGVSEQAPTG